LFGRTLQDLLLVLLDLGIPLKSSAPTIATWIATVPMMICQATFRRMKAPQAHQSGRGMAGRCAVWMRAKDET